jgi:hypothetical protein
VATDVLETSAAPIVGVGANGRVVVAWVETRGIYAVSRASDGTWSPVVQIDAYQEYAGIETVRDVIVDDSGAALLVLQLSDAQLRTAWAPPSASPALSWSEPVELAATVDQSVLDLKIHRAAGKAVVTWQDGSSQHGARAAYFDFATGAWDVSPELGALADCGVKISAVLDGPGGVTAYWLDHPANEAGD